MPPPSPDPALRLLFDEHLSRRLIVLLADVFPGALHVAVEGLESASDDEVWEHARENGLVIVTKDADFHQRSFLFGAPPKVVWVRLGNCTTDEVAELRRRRVQAVTEFVADPEATFLEVG